MEDELKILRYVKLNLDTAISHIERGNFRYDFVVISRRLLLKCLRGEVKNE